jgi:hypothetical protein
VPHSIDTRNVRPMRMIRCAMSALKGINP